MTEATVLVLGTCDTKLQELLFLKKQVQQGGVGTILLDVGREAVQHEGINVPQAQLIKDYGDGKSSADLPRSEVIKLMAGCAARAVQKLLERGEIAGVISAGGSGGTALAAQVMRDVLPIGFPKVRCSLSLRVPLCLAVGGGGVPSSGVGRKAWRCSIRSAPDL